MMYPLTHFSRSVYRFLGLLPALAAYACFVAQSAGAATLSVPSQYATIDAALTAASAGDVIALDPTQGPYSAANDLNVTVLTSVTIES